MKALLPSVRVERTILLIRGHKVMLDMDLAHLYGVTTKRLNEQVKRNRNRFPVDFKFRLTSKEKAEVVANCGHLAKLKGFGQGRPLRRMMNWRKIRTCAQRDNPPNRNGSWHLYLASRGLHGIPLKTTACPILDRWLDLLRKS